MHIYCIKKSYSFLNVFVELTVIDHNESILINNPTCGTQLFKPLMRHIRSYMVLKTMTEINVILLEKD
jgi:hypothetical protein